MPAAAAPQVSQQLPHLAARPHSRHNRRKFRSCSGEALAAWHICNTPEEEEGPRVVKAVEETYTPQDGPHVCGWLMHDDGQHSAAAWDSRGTMCSALNNPACPPLQPHLCHSP